MTASRSHPQLPRAEFERRAIEEMPEIARCERLSVVTVEAGRRCNLSCDLCRTRCSPTRPEVMSRGAMLEALSFAAEVMPERIELVGGEPLLWPHLKEFLQLAGSVVHRVRIHTNLVALLEPGSRQILAALAETRAELLASVPEMLEDRTAAGCTQALLLLSRAGYGTPERGEIPLDLLYTPMAGSLPRPRAELEAEYREALGVHDIGFRSFVTLAQPPLGGFADWLAESNAAEQYRSLLHEAFDPEALGSLPCRFGIVIGWDGTLWDCESHCAAAKPLAEEPRQVSEYVGSPVAQISLSTRRIEFAEHCFACTARSGTAPGFK